MATVFGEVTLQGGVNNIVVSGFSTVPGYPVNNVTLIAHPSNSGVLYVRQRGASLASLGYPLAAGATLALANVDLYQYTVSGVASQRLAWSADR